MPHDGAQNSQDHSPVSAGACGSCCGGQAIEPTNVQASEGRSFHVSGLDCAEAVSYTHLTLPTIYSV